MKILITGAAGRLGSYMAKNLQGEHELVLTDIKSPKQKTANFIKADLADFNAMKKLCKGVDIVLHFGGSCDKETPWEELLPNNVIGSRNVFEAAAEAGCARVIFASSINAVDGYAKGMNIPATALPKPPNLYGAAKVFAEAMGSYYADKRNLSVICLRFGWIADKDDKRIQTINRGEFPVPSCDRVIIFEDAAQLIQKAITAPKKIKFGIFNALSDNTNKRLDISQTEKILGYKPEYNAFIIAEKKSGITPLFF